MPKKISHFRLGMFILTGTAILAATLISLGAGVLMEDTVPAETYFDESVQGLDIGAPVKFRGVKIGTVSSIDFIVQKYPVSQDTGRYVLVEMELNEKTVENTLGFAGPSMIDRLNEQGLRVRLTTQGLTGVGFLEINFFDPSLNPPLPISWSPKDIYIPSAPSTMSRIEGAVDNIGRVMQQLQTVDFKKFSESLDDFLEGLTRALSEANVKDLGELAAQNLAELRQALKRVNVILSSKEADQLIPEATGAAAKLNSILKSSKDDIVQSAAQIRRLTANLEKASLTMDKLLSDPALAKSLEKAPETLDNISQASGEIKQSTIQLNRLLRNLSELVLAQRSNINGILEETRDLINNLNALTNDVRQNPSRLILSEPPPKTNPEKLP